jgi:hypothetical protein
MLTLDQCQYLIDTKINPLTGRKLNPDARNGLYTKLLTNCNSRFNFNNNRFYERIRLPSPILQRRIRTPPAVLPRIPNPINPPINSSRISTPRQIRTPPVVLPRISENTEDVRPTTPNSLVEIYCVNERGKLRVRINNPAYPTEANCQFPRDIRQDGKHWLVRASDIKLIVPKHQPGKAQKKAFFRVSADNLTEPETQVFTNLHIYGEIGECDVCFVNQKNVVLYPCCHFVCCNVCANNPLLNSCPMCRANIERIIPRDNIQ